MTDHLTEKELVRRLSQQCELAGGQAAWAAIHGVPRSQLCEALNGTRQVTESIANAAGFIRIVRFVPIRGGSNG